MHEFTMNTYLLLLRKKRNKDGKLIQADLDPSTLREITDPACVGLLDVAATVGPFEGFVLCHAESDREIARVAKQLRGWDCVTLSAINHMRFVDALPVAPSIEKSHV